MEEERAIGKTEREGTLFKIRATIHALSSTSHGKHADKTMEKFVTLMTLATGTNLQLSDVCSPGSTRIHKIIQFTNDDCYFHVTLSYYIECVIITCIIGQVLDLPNPKLLPVNTDFTVCGR